MRIRSALTSCSLLLTVLLNAQAVHGVYKINDLLRRTSMPDTLYVVNFWATWCKPCVQELPAFDSLYTATRNQPVKIILVNLDFKEDLEKKVNPFLEKNHIRVECVLLDEINGNDFINKVSTQWSGAIPATLFSHKPKSGFAEKKMTLTELKKEIKAIQP